MSDPANDQSIAFFRTVASSETNVAGLAQLWSFPLNLNQEDPLKDAIHSTHCST